MSGNLKARAEAAHIRVDAARASVPGVDAVFGVVGRDTMVGGNLMASAIAYRLFLWLLPFSLVLAAVAGFIHAANPNGAADLADELGLSAYVASIVSQAAAQAESSRWAALIVGVSGLYFASAAGAKTIWAAHGLVWGAPVRRRRRTLKGAAAFMGIAGGGLALPLGAHRVHSSTPGVGVIAVVAVFLGYAGLWLAASYLTPHGDAPLRGLVPGALFMALGMQIIQLGTIYFLDSRIESASALYGGLGAAATILLWLYLIGRLAVGAAAINATLWERSRPRDLSP